MIAGVGQSIELPALFEAHRDSPSARQLHDFFHARVLPPFAITMRSNALPLPMLRERHEFL